MKFCLIDRIVEVTRGERIVAVKAVSLAEEYLADHFPMFPVLPKSRTPSRKSPAPPWTPMTWLVREATDFAARPILLRSVRNVTYKSFVRPGHLLTLDVTCRRLGRDESEFAGVGHCADTEVVRGKFVLTHRVDAAAGDGVASAEASDVLRARFADLQRS